MPTTAFRHINMWNPVFEQMTHDKEAHEKKKTVFTCSLKIPSFFFLSLFLLYWKLVALLLLLAVCHCTKCFVFFCHCHPCGYVLPPLRHCPHYHLAVAHHEVWSTRLVAHTQQSERREMEINKHFDRNAPFGFIIARVTFSDRGTNWTYGEDEKKKLVFAVVERVRYV